MKDLNEEPTPVVAGGTPGASNDGSMQSTCRSVTSEVAGLTGGGIAVIFTLRQGSRTEEDRPRLRAAAGFPSSEEARECARVVLPAVLEAALLNSATRIPPIDTLGKRAMGDLVIFPLTWGDRTHGALVAGAPAALGSEQIHGIENLTADLGLRLDHAHLSTEIEDLRKRRENSEPVEEEKNDEILRLSEALFTQDIELIRSSEKMGMIEKLKSDFIEKMSRELRTPLNGIIEAIISVLTGEDDALSESAKALLRRALDNGTAFLRTLQNILDLWRIKQGELPVEIQDINFREVVEEAVFSVQDSIGGKPLRIEQHIEEPFPTVRTDLTKVNQVLFLLLDNAVKFTHRGQIDISARVKGERLVCEVRDTGVGISRDDVPIIFDEFFQVDDSASVGAGLGLTLARDLVILLDGGITIESEIGRGTTALFDVPVQICS